MTQDIPNYHESLEEPNVNFSCTDKQSILKFHNLFTQIMHAKMCWNLLSFASKIQ